ncbi:hypothetical protein ACFL2R_03675 [Patescibacteria group bacterium]
MKKIGRNEIIIGAIVILIIVNLGEIINLFMLILGLGVGALIVGAAVHIPFVYEMYKEYSSNGSLLEDAFDVACRKVRFRLSEKILKSVPNVVYVQCFKLIKNFKLQLVKLSK